MANLLVGAGIMFVGILFGYVLGHHSSAPVNTSRDDDE